MLDDVESRKPKLMNPLKQSQTIHYITELQILQQPGTQQSKTVDNPGHFIEGTTTSLVFASILFLQKAL